MAGVDRDPTGPPECPLPAEAEGSAAKYRPGPLTAGAPGSTTGGDGGPPRAGGSAGNGSPAGDGSATAPAGGPTAEGAGIGVAYRAAAPRR